MNPDPTAKKEYTAVGGKKKFLDGLCIFDALQILCLKSPSAVHLSAVTNIYPHAAQALSGSELDVSAR